MDELFIFPAGITNSAGIVFQPVPAVKEGGIGEGEGKVRASFRTNE
jgi:hypothetical protein